MCFLLKSSQSCMLEAGEKLTSHINSSGLVRLHLETIAHEEQEKALSQR